MRVTAFLLGLVASVSAQNVNYLDVQNPFKIPTSGLSFVAGQTSPIQWTPSTNGTVTLVLRSGNSNNLAIGTPIATNIANSGTYSWSVPAGITRGDDYTIQIIADSRPEWVNYTPYFHIESPNTVASSTQTFTYGAATSQATRLSALSSVNPTNTASAAAFVSSASASLLAEASAQASSSATATRASSTGSLVTLTGSATSAATAATSGTATRAASTLSTVVPTSTGAAPAQTAAVGFAVVAAFGAAYVL